MEYPLRCCRGSVFQLRWRVRRRPVTEAKHCGAIGNHAKCNAVFSVSAEERIEVGEITAANNQTLCWIPNSH